MCGVRDMKGQSLNHCPMFSVFTTQVLSLNAWTQASCSFATHPKIAPSNLGIRTKWQVPPRSDLPPEEQRFLTQYQLRCLSTK